jgi:hypothetical protein
MKGLIKYLFIVLCFGSLINVTTISSSYSVGKWKIGYKVYPDGKTYYSTSEKEVFADIKAKKKCLTLGSKSTGTFINELVCLKFKSWDPKGKVTNHWPESISKFASLDTYAVSNKGKNINKDFYKFKKISIPLSKDGQWKLIGTKKASVHDIDLTWKYFAQLDGNDLSKLIEVLHITGSKYSPNEVANWFKNFTFQKNGYKSCIPKSGSGQSANLREKYYVYEEVNSSVVNCFLTRNMNTDDEITNQLIKRNTSYVDTNSLANIVKEFIGNEIKLPKIMLRSDHYFYSRNGLYAYFEMINPEVNGAPKTLFTPEKENEYYPSNINAHPKKKDFYLNWIKIQAKKHLEFENKLVKSQKYRLDLAKYLGDGVIDDFNEKNKAEKIIKVADNLQSSDLTKNQEKINNNEIKVDAKICIKKWPSSKSNEPELALVKKSKLCPGPDGGRKYKIVKFKDLAHVHEQTLKKRNICYNENKNRIQIRKRNCKEKEFYLKYKELNNEDIFYYETEKTQIAKEEPSQTQKVTSKVKAKKKVKVAKVEEPKQEEFKPKKTIQDNEAPIIKIAESITVNDTSYILEGSVTDKADKIFVEIDGDPVEVKKGKFKVQRYSPVDEQIEIVAIDQWGNKSKTKLVNITINIDKTVVAKKLEPLNPSNILNPSSDNKVALVIGIENYTEAPKANYANLDATYFFDYARRAFGVQKQNINLLVNEEATVVKTDKAVSLWLKSKIKKNKSDLIIFFAGHGLASSNGKELYLLPQDGNPDRLERTALSRTDLFKEIISLNPKSVTMFLDTCYSGVSRDEQMLLASARPIRIIANEQEGIPDNFTIFSASQLDQISSGLKEAKHGIFSYYLMKGLEGNADTNQDNDITNGELLAYMDENISQKAAEQGRKQNPSLTGNPDKILMSYR